MSNTSAGYDVLHIAARAPLTHRLYAEAFGEQYVPGVAANSSCSWFFLGTAISALRLPPDALLADLGCGRGGPGLWLARAMNTRLVGVDFSPAGIEDARSRAPEFGLAGRAEFSVGTFASTGLESSSVDGALSLDAFFFAPDYAEGLAEVHRILRPGGRFVFTARDTHADWTALLDTAGFALENTLVHEGTTERWLRLFDLWVEHEAELRAEIGDEMTGYLLEESSTRSRLDGTTPLVFVARREQREGT
ncbi:class I SAM-dependent methyltransferase [Actinokineospora auranticolor]|uniref:Methyltransferase family protein n=1 Tax=Actinokineospora auranticolor TaxID=155976 RepID=A0A2S6GRU5_9PSEU|nr:class I SAM-dependent methyltransferase [Actinokineospora auranticolor]PPK67968.1 methyltransferase family protein [Actinokineospora auranticolor]